MSTVDPNNPKRFLFSTGTRYEFRFGYSRAVRHGSVVRIAGTAGLGDDDKVVSDDVVEQMRAAVARMKQALEDLGCSLGDVIMTRVYVKRVEDIENVEVIHGDVFRDIRPATTIVQIGNFVDPHILVEIEAEAVYGGADEKK